MGTTGMLLLGLVLLFSIWPFIIIRTQDTTRVVLFQVAVSVLLMIAGVLGAVFALPIGPVQVSLGNIAYAAVIMTSVAMFAATRDPRVIRDAIRLVVAVNLVNLGVLALTAGALRLPTTLAPDGVAAEAFSISIRSAVVGGLLHIVQLVLLAVVMERTRRSHARPASVGAVTVGAFLVALALDGAAFPALVTMMEPELGALLSAGWAGVAAKLALGLLYAVPLAAFLMIHQQQHEAEVEAVDLRGLLFAPRRELLSTVSDAVAERDELDARLAEVVDSVTDGLVWIDADGHVTFLNEVAAAALGRSREAVLGRPVWDVAPHVLGTPVEAELRRVVETRAPGVLLSDEIVPERWTELRLYPARDGVVALGHDVTERVAARHRLEGLAAAEQRAADRLREVDELKNTFLTAVSHELRTPLTVVQGMAETLHRLPDEALDPARRSELQTSLLVNSHRLRDLLDDLLDVDRLIRGVSSVEPGTCDMAALVREVVTTHPARRRMHLEVPERVSARLDGPRVERILVNLLDNAAKYAPDGPITVSLTVIGEERLRLVVADEGPGIPAEELEQVFAAFHRVDADHPQPGTGIGLALVREFAQLHGGRAWAVDTGGAGARVFVELPLDAVSQSA